MRASAECSGATRWKAGMEKDEDRSLINYHAPTAPGWWLLERAGNVQVLLSSRGRESLSVGPHALINALARLGCKLFAPKLARCSQAIDLRKWLLWGRLRQLNSIVTGVCAQNLTRQHLREKHSQVDKTVISTAWSHRSIVGIISLFDKKIALFPLLCIVIIFAEAKRGYATPMRKDISPYKILVTR